MAIEYVPYNLTPEQVAELWDGYAAEQTVSQLARRFDKRQASHVPADPGVGRDPSHDPEASSTASDARGP
jgi:hypothetical protein